VDIERRAFLGSGIALLAASAAQAQDQPTPFAGDPAAPFWPPNERFALWPGQPPGAPKSKIVPNWTMNVPAPNRELWIRGVPIPEVHVFRAAKPDGSALLSLPGGGYQFLSVQNEGIDVAERFNAERTTVFVLTYRLPGEGWANRWNVPLADAQRAMRLIRSRASSLRIDPARLGVIGFSAGGHLAADLAVAHDEPVYKPVDAADELSARPAFLGLVYPVVTLINPGQASTSMGTLLGASPPAGMAEKRSPVLHVSKATPPTFLVHGAKDGLVPVWHSFRWADACWNAGVAAELHAFSETEHGFGLHIPKDMPGSRWPDLFALWMRKHGG
jgi:acetyl esterase/lipase